jgi:carboxyl-terminal processing protease
MARRSWATTGRMFLVMSVVLFCRSSSLAGPAEDMAQELKKNVTVTMQYEVGTEAKFSLSKNQSALLSCTDIKGPVSQILVGWREWPGGNGTIACSLLFSDGRVCGEGKGVNGNSGTVRRNMVLNTRWPFRADWVLERDTMKVTFFASTAPTAIQRIYPTMSADERIEIFVRAWSEVKYNFANFDKVPDLNWDKVLTEYLPLVRKDQTNWEFARLMIRCIAQLRDGHTAIFIPDLVAPIISQQPPVQVEYAEGKAIIVAVGNQEDMKQAKLAPGTEITHVDGRSVRQLLEEEYYPYICQSTAQARDLQAYGQLLDGPKDSTAVLTVRSLDGATRELQLKRTQQRFSAVSWAGRGDRKPGWFSDKIYYMPLDSFGDKGIVAEFDRAFNDILKADGLILDVRNNGGGNSAFGDAIISYLTDKPLQTSRWKTREYMPAFRAWGQKEKWHEEQGEPVKPIKDRQPFLGPVVVLTGPRTFSAAEDFLIPLHASGRATLVGRATGGSTGQPLQVQLPCGASMRICTKRDTYPDGREFVGVGVIPDVRVEPTQADVAAGLYSDGGDPVFDKGVEVLKAAIAQGRK